MQTRKEPTFPHRRCLAIVRPPAVGKIAVHPLVDDHTIVCLHRMDGRTIPCLDQPCPFCAMFMRKDEKIFFPATRLQDDTLVIVELPISHHERLVGVRMQYGSLHNVFIEMQRSKPFANAPIELGGGPIIPERRAKPLFHGLLDELALVWTKNVEFALDKIMGEKTTSKFAPGCEIGGRHES